MAATGAAACWRSDQPPCGGGVGVWLAPSRGAAPRPAAAVCRRHAVALGLAAYGCTIADSAAAPGRAYAARAEE